jgi:hypothetical protein
MSLVDLSSKTSFYITAMFAVLENLLTTDPYVTRGAGSITHQLCNKILLINEQLEDKIYIYGQIPINTIVKKLYEFRSTIAHGDVPDFENKFQALSDNETARSLLYDITKKCLLFSIDNSQLIMNLRKC